MEMLLIIIFIVILVVIIANLGQYSEQVRTERREAETEYIGRVGEETTEAIVSAYRKDIRLPEYAHIDLSIAMENIWLQTDAEGLGGVWLGIAPDEDRMKKVEEVLNIPNNLRAFAIFPFGYPDEEREQQNRFDESRIHYVE